MMTAILRSAAEAALEYAPDVIVHHPKVLSAPVAAARLDVPHVLVELVPTLTPTRAFPAAGVTTVDLGPLNPVTYRAAAAASGMFAGTLRTLRADLGLAARGPLPPPELTLVPVSTVLLERPPDWPATTQITGAWHHAAAVSVPVPFLGDQRFWAALLYRRGLGTAPVPPSRLTAAALTEALGSLPASTVAARAAQVMDREDGCAMALGLLEQVAHAR